MESLTASQAREHIEMVDHILARTERSLQVGGEFFVVWGLFSAGVTLMAQLVADRRLPQSSLWVLPVLLAVAIAISVIRGGQLGRRKDGLSLIQREYFAVLWISLGAAMFTDIAGYRIFTTWASSAIWTVAAAIVLLFIATHGNRRALAGGIILLLSLAAANFMPAYTGYALSAGMLFGYAGFGLVSLTARD
ncbi:MAG TPA: hypothetical protein VFO29_01065 [Candidatus Rubrimentiphilum sp.]|nr:hypothetical protein [Candidatus Rubrimentiphilum sp.]